MAFGCSSIMSISVWGGDNIQNGQKSKMARANVDNCVPSRESTSMGSAMSNMSQVSVVKNISRVYHGTGRIPTCTFSISVIAPYLVIQGIKA